MTARGRRGLVERILAGMLRDVDLEGLLGDLTEERALRRAQTSARSASGWYRRQLVVSTPPLLWAFVRRGSWALTLGVALAAFAIASLLELAAEALVSPYLEPGGHARTLVVLVIGLAAIALAGRLAALARRGAAGALALVVAITVVLLMVTAGDRTPLWYQLGFLVAGPAAALAGGALRSGRRARPEITSGRAR